VYRKRKLHHVQQHSLTGKFRVEGTPDIYCSTFCSKQDQTRLLREFFQDHSGLEGLQGQRLHSLSGQPATMFDFPNGEEIFPYTQSKPHLFPFCCLLSSYCGQLWRACVCLLNDLLVEGLENPPFEDFSSSG